MVVLHCQFFNWIILVVVHFKWKYPGVRGSYKRLEQLFILELIALMQAII